MGNAATSDSQPKKFQEYFIVNNNNKKENSKIYNILTFIQQPRAVNKKKLYSDKKKQKTLKNSLYKTFCLAKNNGQSLFFHIFE